MVSLPPPSASYRLLVDAAGEEAAIALCLARGGTRMVVPARSAGSVLEGIVGAAAASKIVDAHSGREISIPLEKKRIGLILLRQGHSQEQTARLISVSRRTVQNWVSGSSPAFPTAQQDLFADL